MAAYPKCESNDIILCISVIGVVVNFVRFKKNVFSILGDIPNK